MEPIVSLLFASLLILFISVTDIHLLRSGDMITCERLADLHLARRKEGCKTTTAFIKYYSFVYILISPNQRHMYIYYNNTSVCIDIQRALSSNVKSSHSHRISPFLQSSVQVNVIGKYQSVTRTYHLKDLSLYSGECPNETSTFFHGTISKGHVEGYILLPQGKFLLEPSVRYFLNETWDDETRIKHIFYSSEDLVYEPRIAAKYANNDDLFKTRNSEQTSSTASPWHHAMPLKGHHPFVKNKSGAVYTNPNMVSFASYEKDKNKLVPGVKRYCTLSMVLDHLFIKYSTRGDVKDAVSSTLYLVGQADTIFRRTDFNGDGFGDNVGFQIKTITAYLTPDIEGYELFGKLDDTDYLKKFSKFDFSDVCMGAGLTYRDFDAGILGLAWRASSSYFREPGGICELRRHYERQPSLSFNSLFITQYNHMTHVPLESLSLTFTHELGHSFGAGHDDDPNDIPARWIPICAPTGSEDGQFLMHSYSSSGYKANNWKFSICSKMAISAVIQNKGKNCLIYETMPHCGNLLVEEGEQCDCGDVRYCDQVDQCCLPPRPAGWRNGTGTKFLGLSFSEYHQCSIARHLGHECSPVASLCCDDQCHVVPASANLHCAPETECFYYAVCDGFNATCPQQKPKPDNDTRCLFDNGVCQKGKCVSLCTMHGYELCECDYELYPQDVCKVCCMVNSTEACTPAWDLGLTNSNGSVLYLHPGASCNRSLGVCTEEHQCVDKHVDIPEREQPTEDWLQSHWYVLLMATGGLVFLVFLIYTKVQRGLSNRKRHRQIQLAASSYAVALDVKLRQLSEKYKAAVKHLESEQCKSLTTLFPTATLADIRDITRGCGTDKEAVMAMVGRGYPMVPTNVTEEEVELVKSEQHFL